MKYFSKTLLSVTLAGFFIACGGSGGGNENPTTKLAFEKADLVNKSFVLKKVDGTDPMGNNILKFKFSDTKVDVYVGQTPYNSDYEITKDKYINIKTENPYMQAYKYISKIKKEDKKIFIATSSTAEGLKDKTESEFYLEQK